MAPTVCMTDFPETGNSHVCARRRQRIQDRSICKRQKGELKKVSSKTFEIQETTLSHPLSPISRARCPTDSYVPIILRSTRQFSTSTPDNQWKMAMRRDGLVDIFIRTIALVRRNHILQRRVNALREETQNFISTMMNNPGNESHNEKDSNVSSHENSQVSSTTENNSRSPSPGVLDSKINSKSINDSRTNRKSDKSSKLTKTDLDSNKVSSTSEIVTRTQKTSSPQKIL